MQCLILDDDKLRLQQFSQWLTQESVSLTMVETAPEAIEQLNRNQFHAIFLDHNLGDEVYVDSGREDTGMEVVRKIIEGECQQDPRTCFVVHSMNTQAGFEMVCKLKDAGYNNTFYCSFGDMLRMGGPQLQEN